MIHNERVRAPVHAVPSTIIDPATKRRHAHPNEVPRVHRSRPDRTVRHRAARSTWSDAAGRHRRPGTKSAIRPRAIDRYRGRDPDCGEPTDQAPDLAK